MSTMGYVTTLSGAEDAASVVFDFQNQNYRTTQGKKSFTELFTTTRPTTAGRYNSKGLWEMMPVNTARFEYNPITKKLRGLLIEEQRTNLLDYTDHLTNVLWGASISTASAVPSPLSEEECLGHSMWRWTWKNTDTVFWASKSPNFTTVGKYTFSYMIAKKSTAVYNYCQLNHASIGSFTHEINLMTGEAKVSVVGKELATVEDFGTLWRVKIPVEATATGVANIRVGLYRLTTAANLNESFDWGCPQLENAVSALSYIPASTTFSSRSGPATYFDKNGLVQTAAYNVVRSNTYVYDTAGKLKPNGLQIESTAVNLLRGNRGLNLSPWSYVGITNTPYSEIAPDGTLTAFKVVEGLGVTTPKEFRQLLPAAMTAGNPYTLSMYVKASPGADRRIALGFGSSTVTSPPVSSVCIFNLKDGTINTTLTTSRANVQILANGWMRLSLTVDCTITAVTTCYFTMHGTGAGNEGGPSYTGDGVSGCLAWAPQLELGGYASSTIYSDASFTSRSTTATYFDSGQVMQTAPVNVLRDNAYAPDGKKLGVLLEPASTNLVTNSNDMSKWGASRVTVYPNSEVSPDGKLTATYVVANTLADWHTLVSSSVNPINVVAGLTYTASVFAKAGPGDKTLRMGLTNSNIFSTTNTVVFNLKNGTIQLGNAGTITPAGNGWYLCTVTSPAKIDGLSTISTSPADATGNGQAAGDDINGIYLWGGMVEKGTFSTSFIPTIGTFTGRTSTATYIDQFGVMQTEVAGVERNNTYGYDSRGTIQPIGILREGAGGNLQFPSNGAGTLLPNGATYIDSGQRFLDGVTPMFKLVENTATSSHYALTPPKSFGINRQYTTSFYIKAMGRTKLSMQLQQFSSWGGGNTSIVVDLIAKTITSGGLKYGSITEMANGFFRVSCTATCITAHSGAGWYPVMLDDTGGQTYAGDGSSGFIIGGWMVELLPEGSSIISASSYIPTTTGVVNRSADVFTTPLMTRAEDIFTTAQTTRPGDVTASVGMTRTGETIFTDIAPWYNKATSTVYTEFYPGIIGYGNTNVSVWLRGANNNDLAVIRKDGSVNNITGIITNSTGTIQAQLTALDSPVPYGTQARSALTWAANSAAFSNNGATPAFDNVVGVPNPTQLYVGSASNGQQFCNGIVSKIMYYPIRLSNSQLQSMTA